MADQFFIKGLSGRRKLSGKIRVTGAKNAVLKSFAASLLFNDAVVVSNVPDIEDVSRVKELLEDLGATVAEKAPGTYAITTSGVSKSDLDDAVARRLRASIVFAGPLLARFGRVSFPHPGGDIIGPRPINFFLEGFEKMGGKVSFENDRYTVTAERGLRGAEIFFMFITVTGTETLMLAATLAKGTTVLKNAAMEPEIVALADFLNACGARITGAGTPTITIEGGGMLHADGKELRTIPDRIEAGSFLLLGALCAEDLEITDCNPEHIEILIRLLRESGMSVTAGENSVSIRSSTTPQFKALRVRTHEYPGFATDLQPPMTVYLTQAEGESTVFETIWRGRLNYTQDLVSMGANITLANPQQITIKGPTPLTGRTLESPDIRAGLAFLLAASVAKGDSVINNVYHIDRGYERIEERLSKIGLPIERRRSA